MTVTLSTATNKQQAQKINGAVGEVSETNSECIKVLKPPIRKPDTADPEALKRAQERMLVDGSPPRESDSPRASKEHSQS